MILSGLRVLDVSDGVAGGYCTRLLAGMGADVVKVERPGTGDTARRLGPFPNDTPDPELSAIHLYIGAGKRSLVLDWRRPEGRDVLLRLVEKADVFVSSLTRRQAEDAGLSLEALRAANPALHAVSITPWGATGPYADRPGDELTVEALGGFAALHGVPPREPHKLPGWQIECFAGAHAAMAALAAAFEGEPAEVDVSCVEAMVNALEADFGLNEFTGKHQPRMTGGLKSEYPMRVYECADGHMALAIIHPRDWEGLTLMLGDDELRENTDYQMNLLRVVKRDELDARLEPLLKERSVAGLWEMALLLRSAIGMVLDARGLAGDLHLREREAIREVEHPVAGRYSMPAAPFIMSDDGWRCERAPLLGEHTDGVLREWLGLDGDEIAGLRERGVV